MKKSVACLLAGILLVGACTDKGAMNDELMSEDKLNHRMCGAMEVLESQLAADPKLRTRLESIEDHTRAFVESGRVPEGGILEIPVVVNVIYRTSTENISDAQIQSQIDVLNEDFNLQNADHTATPAEFSGVLANYGLKFTLVSVVRKYSTKKSWSTNDAMKKSSQGGIDPTSPTTHLNMWVVNKITSGRSTILGYAQFPGGDPATDGVVIGHNFFGRTGVVSAPFDKGRTATHEVGHWVNLRHIWGDATCGNDFVSDTPQHNAYNYGCPTYPHKSTCTGTPNEMTMNFMDYTDDACMYMFTNGQKSRSWAIFAEGGARASFNP
jgi:hypothetical protein